MLSVQYLRYQRVTLGKAMQTMRLYLPPKEPWQVRYQPKPTSAEKQLRQILQVSGIPQSEIRAQYAVAGYYLDLYIPRLSVGIEVDGQYHQKPEQIEHDRMREAKLATRGISIYRIRNEDVATEKVADLVAFLRQKYLAMPQARRKYKKIAREHYGQSSL